MKRIAVCCDGTWNDPTKPKQTNVSKLNRAIIRRGPNEGGTEQRVCYIDGVGAKGPLWKRLWGGAVGYGLGENVQKAYRFIAENYDPGDEIYLFGFSRGAYTARSTLGMVRKCGVLKHVSEDSVRHAWDHYRDEVKPESQEGKEWRSRNSLLITPPENHVPLARFIGVWDTVGSLGVPIKQLRDNYDFHDVTLTSHVERAYQALAIDERRKDYEPTLWAQSANAGSAQHFEQRWFSGVHSDVGGGAAREGRDSQSDYCLEWILEKAEDAGLDVDRAAVEWDDVKPPAFRRIHLDQNWFFDLIGVFRGKIWRAIGKGVTEAKKGTGPSNETVDPEARRRLKESPGYRPKNLMRWEAQQPKQR